MPYRDQPPVIVGIVGDSGAGKSTLASGIRQVLGDARVTDLPLDDYQKYTRAERRALGLSGLHPDCHILPLARQHLMLLRRGETVFKPVYDHRDGTFARPEYLAPRQFVLAHGVLGYPDDFARSCYHVAVFLDPDPDLHLEWKVKRDVAQRGYGEDQVRNRLPYRRLLAQRHVGPQRWRSDVVISFYPQPGYWATRDDTGLAVRIELDHAPLAAALGDLLPEAAHLARRAGAPRPYLAIEASPEADAGFVLEVDGAIPEALATAVEDRLWAEMPRIRHLRAGPTGQFPAGKAVKRSATLAIAQLLVTYLAVEAAESIRDQQEPFTAAV